MIPVPKPYEEYLLSLGVSLGKKVQPMQMEYKTETLSVHKPGEGSVRQEVRVPTGKEIQKPCKSNSYYEADFDVLEKLILKTLDVLSSSSASRRVQTCARWVLPKLEDQIRYADRGSLKIDFSIENAQERMIWETGFTIREARVILDVFQREGVQGVLTVWDFRESSMRPTLRVMVLLVKNNRCVRNKVPKPYPYVRSRRLQEYFLKVQKRKQNQGEYQWYKVVGLHALNDQFKNWENKARFNLPDKRLLILWKDDNACYYAKLFSPRWDELNSMTFDRRGDWLGRIADHFGFDRSFFNLKTAKKIRAATIKISGKV